MTDTQLRSETLGADIRALRKSRGLTLETMAQQLGRSVGWVSQVERDKSTPSIDDLRLIASELCVPLSIFFGQANAADNERGLIVRADTRRHIGEGSGLTEALLSPDLTDDFEVLHCEFAPGARQPDPVSRPTTEVGTVISGNLSLWINTTRYDLKTGDSFRIKGDPYHWENPHSKPARVIWVISPPVY